MGFFDKLFGGKSKDENTAKFTNQSKTVLTPLQGKVLAQADIPDEMVDVQAQQMMENFQQQLAAQGIPFDQYLKTDAGDQSPATPYTPPLTVL